MTSRHIRAAILTACRKPMQAKFDEGQRRRERCRAMLDALGATGPKPFQREPGPAHLRGIGNIARAAHGVAP